MAKFKAVWALNPFQNNQRLHGNIAALAKLLLKNGGAVDPVFVVSPAEANVALEFSVPARDRFQKVGLEELQRTLKKLKISGLGQPRVLVEPSLSLRSSVARLAADAAKQKAQAILVGTQARSGLGRALLGSFAESLLGISTVPLLLVNPGSKASGPMKKILFATDFSAGSLKAFKNFCDFAAAMQAGICLAHVLPTPFPWVTRLTQALWSPQAPSMAEYFKLLEEIREDEAEPFAEVARRRGIPLDLAIEPSEREIGSTILGIAKKQKVGAIAMAAQSHKLQTALLGAASRTVLREAKVPVWVQRV